MGTARATVSKAFIVLAVAAAAVVAEPKSALEFYDSTGSNATARFGWEGSQANGKFFLQAPVGTDAVTVQGGNMQVGGEVTATGFNGNGSGLSHIGSAQIEDGAIVDDDINGAAGISGTKINPDFGSSNVRLRGKLYLGHDASHEFALRCSADPGGAGWYALNFFKPVSGVSAFTLLSRGNDAYDNFYAMRGDVAVLRACGSDVGGRLSIGVDSLTAGRIALWHDRTDGWINTSPGSLKIITQTGFAYINGQQVQTIIPSDARLKRNVEQLTDAIDRVEKLNGVYFDYEGPEERALPKDRQLGLLAQDVQQAVPEAVLKDQYGYLAVDYEKLVALLVEATKDQERRLKEQQKQIEELRRALKRQ
jgi:hypothetical protein